MKTSRIVYLDPDVVDMIITYADEKGLSFEAATQELLDQGAEQIKNDPKAMKELVKDLRRAARLRRAQGGT